MQKQNRNKVYMDNMTVVCAQLELGAAAIKKVVGSEALSNHIYGEAQSTRDFQEIIASRMTKAYGA